ncbi:hypothetical protein BWL13_01637 [Microbacterium oleivorans]|uniref:hypothetical protein n=1 Tax=Microbacterium oleivorans TaxID=273677 RepID=UPI0009755672|nr:hypothetical protein [Microbacterium oleivorans]AZS44055.1 hypothetical protein BWL13_01637 [Microbacterium oleivorans]
MNKILDLFRTLIERREAWLAYEYHRQRVMEGVAGSSASDDQRAERDNAARQAYARYFRPAERLYDLCGGRLFTRYRNA